MSRQDKATTERNARTLREFIKKSENKVCADCKRNGMHPLILIWGSLTESLYRPAVGVLESVRIDTLIDNENSVCDVIFVGAYTFVSVVRASIVALVLISAK
jgi:hypothetical protein